MLSFCSYERTLSFDSLALITIKERKWHGEPNGYLIYPVIMPDPEPEIAPPVIPAESFAWAHRLADEYGGDASALVNRAEWRLMIEEALIAFDISKVDLVSARRHASVTWARQCCMWLLKTYTPQSLPEIGRKLGDKDHTTVLHGVRAVREAIERVAIPITKATEWRDALRVLAEYKTKPARRPSCP